MDGELPRLSTPTGKIRCGKFARGSVHPKLDGYMNMVVCSVNGNWGQLSPMKLGPFIVTEELSPLVPGGVCPGFIVSDIHIGKQVAMCQNFENYWQYSKVYSVDNVNGILGESFFNRRAEGFQSTKAKRRVFPAKSGITTLCSYYDGKLYQYLESRVFYCSGYSMLAEAHAKYKEIKRIMESGQNILILDLDAPSWESHNQELTPEFFEKEYNDTTHPFGHGMVLCSMLLGIKPWQKVM
jgi:hypothetical protein